MGKMQNIPACGYRNAGTVASVTIDGSAEHGVAVTAASDVDLDATNLKVGVAYVLVFVQNGVGGWALDYANLEARYSRVWRNAAIQPTPGAGKVTVLTLHLLDANTVAVCQGNAA